MVVVGDVADHAEAEAMAGRLEPEVIVIGLNMPDVSCGGTLRKIAAASPASRMIVLTVSANESGVLDALQSGACGYLLKSTRVEDLVTGIRQAACGQAVLSPDAIRALVGGVRSENQGRGTLGSGPSAPALTAREMDVLRLIVEGADNAAIGFELSISRHTVKQHVTNIFEKLGVRNRVEAAVYGVRSGLV
jgi:DNA-binding NarL/FixJ family response regulator